MFSASGGAQLSTGSWREHFAFAGAWEGVTAWRDWPCCRVSPELFWCSITPCLPSSGGCPGDRGHQQGQDSGLGWPSLHSAPEDNTWPCPTAHERGWNPSGSCAWQYLHIPASLPPTPQGHPALLQPLSPRDQRTPCTPSPPHFYVPAITHSFYLLRASR